MLLPTDVGRSDAPKRVKIENATSRRLFKVSPITEASSLLKLLTAEIDCSVVVPKRYFRASNELISITLIVCWTITLLVNPSAAIDHPARNYVGHYNPCFGWDYPPASYVAIFLCAIDVYLAITYASLEAMRTKLRDTDRHTTWAERFATKTAYLHGVAALLWMCLWQIGPPDGYWATHLAIFSTAVAFRYLCTLGNYVEARFGKAYAAGLVHDKHTIFIIVYGVVTFTLPTLYFYDVVVYRMEDRQGLDPPLPWYVLQIADIVWVCCLSASSRLAVPEPPLLVTRKVVEIGDEVESSELCSSLLADGHDVLSDSCPEDGLVAAYGKTAQSSPPAA